MAEEEMRLHRFIAQSGLTSRRKAEEWIEQGRVAVNGMIIREQGTKVSSMDVVEVDGERIGIASSVTVILNKPRGYVTTTSDERGRRTVMELLPDLGPLKPVGRLDMDSDGLLILSTDGELAARLSHARYGIQKEYRVVVQGIPSERDLERLRKGIYLDGKKTSPCQVEMLGMGKGDLQSHLSFVIHEGRNRQIRRMCEAIGCPVVSLSRVRFAHFVLKGMKPGECRIIGQKDLERLRKMVGLADQSDA